MGLLDWMGPIGSGVDAVIGGVGNYIANKQNQKNAMDMWNKTNAYNTPLAQKQRMIDAGFNPALMYGNGVQGNVASNQNMPDVKPFPETRFAQSLPSVPAAHQDLALKGATTANVILNNDLMRADLGKKLAETEAIRLGIGKTSATMDDAVTIVRQNAIQATTGTEAGKVALERSKIAKASEAFNLSNQPVEFQNKIKAANQALRNSQQSLRNMKTQNKTQYMEYQLKAYLKKLNDAGLDIHSEPALKYIQSQFPELNATIVKFIKNLF